MIVECWRGDSSLVGSHLQNGVQLHGQLKENQLWGKSDLDLFFRS